MKAIQKALLLSLSVAGLGAVVPTVVSATADIVVDVAPPAPRAEVVPAARAGYVWAPGHYEWNGHFHRWVAGTWIVAHGTYRWAPDRWEQVGDRWHYVRGQWEK